MRTRVNWHRFHKSTKLHLAILFIINFRESETEIFTSDASKKVIQSIIEKHSPDVDVISGATMTPKAIIDAVKKAMDSK